MPCGKASPALAIRRPFWLTCALLAGLFVSAWADAAPARAQLLVVLGDSNAQGFGVGEQAAFPAQMQRILANTGRNVRVSNAGVAGDTFAGMRARAEASVPPGTSVLVVQGGYNDLLSGLTPGQVVANLDALLGRLQGRARTIVVCGFFRPAWDAMGRRVAAAHHAMFVRGSACYDPDNVGPDGLHMSAAGHRIVAARLAAIVAPLLSSRGEWMAKRKARDR